MSSDLATVARLGGCPMHQAIGAGTAGDGAANVPVRTADESATDLQAAVFAAIPALTPQEQVIVKDTWNKLLAFHEMLVDLFFERLLHEEPGLGERFGDAVDTWARTSPGCSTWPFGP